MFTGLLITKYEHSEHFELFLVNLDQPITREGFSTRVPIQYANVCNSLQYSALRVRPLRAKQLVSYLRPTNNFRAVCMSLTSQNRSSPKINFIIEMLCDCDFFDYKCYSILFNDKYDVSPARPHCPRCIKQPHGALINILFKKSAKFRNTRVARSIRKNLLKRTKQGPRPHVGNNLKIRKIRPLHF